MITRDIIERVRIETDLPQLMSESGVRLKRRGHNKVSGLCPFHKEKTPSFHVSKKKGHWHYHCFGCHASGDSMDWCTEYLEQDFLTAISDLAGRIGVVVSNDPAANYDWQNQRRVRPPEPPPKIRAWPEKSIARFAGRLAKYAIERGVDVETARAFELGFDREEKRMIFPVRTRRGVLIGCSGRTVTKKSKLKYLHYRLDIETNRAVARIPWKMQQDLDEEYLENRFRVWHRNRVLFGAFQVSGDVRPPDGWKSNDLFVVEGHFGVTATWRRGHRVVAPMGAHASQEQADIIVDMVPPRGRLIIFYDPDEAGEKGVKGLEKLVYGRVGVWVMRVPNKRIPVGQKASDLSDEELEKLVTLDSGNCNDSEFEQALSLIQRL